MDLRKMLDEQAKLDKLILQRAGIKEYPSNKVKLALLTELGELANEVQSFKYWKQNKNIDRQKVLEEFADCLHFALSLENYSRQLNGTELDNIDDFPSFCQEVLKQTENEGISPLFLETYQDVLKEDDVLLQMLILGICLDISLEQMEEWYYKKHEKNIKRQQTGY